MSERTSEQVAIEIVQSVEVQLGTWYSSDEDAKYALATLGIRIKDAIDAARKARPGHVIDEHGVEHPYSIVETAPPTGRPCVKFAYSSMSCSRGTKSCTVNHEEPTR